MTDTPAPIPPASNPSQPAATDVGAILKQARLRRGQSFEVVFQHTRIPKKFLEALEANRFDEFPAAVYLQGFLKSYCEHLDLDFDPLWSQIRPSQKSEPAKDTRAQEPAQSRSDSSRTPAPRTAEAGPGYGTGGKPIVYVAIGAIAVVAIAAIYWAVPKSGPKPPPPPPLVQHAPEPLAPVVLPPRKMTLQLSFRNEAWMSLRCDGKLRFEGRGPAGFSQTWTAMKEFAIRTSNPEDLNLNLDGKELKLGPDSKTSTGEYLVKRS